MSVPLASVQTYRQNSVLSASPSELVVELYDGARRFLRDAAKAMDEREVERAHNALCRAERILIYLNEVIDDDGGEIAQNLHGLYAFYLEHLSAARATLDRTKVDAVAHMLGDLRDAWQQVPAQ